MDSFGVDLDRVLDDFEESESNNVKPLATPDYTNVGDLLNNLQPDNCTNSLTTYDTIFKPYAGDNSSFSDCEYLKPTDAFASSLEDLPSDSSIAVTSGPALVDDDVLGTLGDHVRPNQVTGSSSLADDLRNSTDLADISVHIKNCNGGSKGKEDLSGLDVLEKLEIHTAIIDDIDPGDKGLGNRDPGDRDQGERDLGDKDLADKDLGDKNLGDKCLGDRDLGDKDLGDKDLGDKDLGDKYLGDKDLGNKDLGDKDLGDKDLGDKDLGDKDLGDKDLGDKDLGDKDLVDKDLGDKDLVDKDLGDKDLGDKDLGDKDLGDKDLGDKDLGDKVLGDKDLGDKDLGDKDLVDKDLGDKDLGDKDLGDKDLVDRYLGDKDLVDRDEDSCAKGASTGKTLDSNVTTEETCSVTTCEDKATKLICSLRVTAATTISSPDLTCSVSASTDNTSFPDITKPDLTTGPTLEHTIAPKPDLTTDPTLEHTIAPKPDLTTDPTLEHTIAPKPDLTTDPILDFTTAPTPDLTTNGPTSNPTTAPSPDLTSLSAMAPTLLTSPFSPLPTETTSPPEVLSNSSKVDFRQSTNPAMSIDILSSTNFDSCESKQIVDGAAPDLLPKSDLESEALHEFGNSVVEVCDIVESTITDTSSQIENDLEVSIYDDLPGEITTPDITAPDLLGTGQLTQPVIIRTVAVGVVDTATASDIAASTVGFVPQKINKRPNNLLGPKLSETNREFLKEDNTPQVTPRVENETNEYSIVSNDEDKQSSSIVQSVAGMTRDQSDDTLSLAVGDSGVKESESVNDTKSVITQATGQLQSIAKNSIASETTGQSTRTHHSNCPSTVRESNDPGNLLLAPTPIVAPVSTAMPRFSILELGLEAPVWVPDAEANTCAHCTSKFTFTKRRHHCRCCGKVFCSTCCYDKSSLIYMDSKEARVCSLCFEDLDRAQVFRCNQLSGQSSPSTSSSTIGVLRKEGSQRRPLGGDGKQVMFSDGVRPGGDLLQGERPLTSRHFIRKHSKSLTKFSKVPKGSLWPKEDNELPPIVVSEEDMIIDMKPELSSVLKNLQNNEIINFLINRNLIIKLQIVNLSCCLDRSSWCLVSNGLSRVGQDELVVVLVREGEDDYSIPTDVMRHFGDIYVDACQGETIINMKQSRLKEHNEKYSGFLFFRPTFQCLQNLPFNNLNGKRYLIGLMLQRWEMLWAEILPLRLILRFGAEYRYYPCPILSERKRKPVYIEIGNTIMKLLADFTDFKYKLECINGVMIHMQDKITDILLPRNRFVQIQKVINSSNDYVMALGGCFSNIADSHLVCMQSDDSNSYQTQAINILLKPRKITGACFIVFNGALKATSGYKARSSIVEDGVMVQVNTETLSKLKQSLLNKEDFAIECGPMSNSVNAEGQTVPAPIEEVVNIRWIEDDNSVNEGITSPIDNKDMKGISSVRLHKTSGGENPSSATSVTFNWTEMFFAGTRTDCMELLKISETLAKCTTQALQRHLEHLHCVDQINCIGLRVEISTEMVGYTIGAKGSQLESKYTGELDDVLIPIIHSVIEGDSNEEFSDTISLELHFHLLD